MKFSKLLFLHWSIAHYNKEERKMWRFLKRSVVILTYNIQCLYQNICVQQNTAHWKIRCHKAHFTWMNYMHVIRVIFSFRLPQFGLSLVCFFFNDINFKIYDSFDFGCSHNPNRKQFSCLTNEAKNMRLSVKLRWDSHTHLTAIWFTIEFEKWSLSFFLAFSIFEVKWHNDSMS